MITLELSPADAILALELAAARYEEYAAENGTRGADKAYYIRKASAWRDMAADIESDYFPEYR